MIDWRDDRGQVAGIEVLPFGLLVFVIGALLVANAWGVVDAKLAATTASREAARAYVEAPDLWTGAARADAAARDAIAGQGRDPAKMQLSLDHEGGRPFARCTRATATVHYPVPVIRLPFIGGFGDGFDVVSSHSELIDPYRAGLPGDAIC